MSSGNVNFHTDVTSGNAPLTVHFTADTPYGYECTYTWNFGDGGGSGKSLPHTYNTPGTYDVSLTISNSSGGSLGNEVKHAYITVYSALPNTPVAEFTTNTTTGPAPLTVQFTGLASGGTLSYDWDFGDGTQHSGDQSPLHVYTNPNNYTVRLKVSNPGGINFKEALIVVTQPVNQSANNSTQMLTATLTPTPLPPTTSAPVTPRSLIPPISIPNISLSNDLVQLILAALVALVIAVAIIFYFTSLSKRRENNNADKGPGSLMQKPRSPVKVSQAPAAKPPAKAPGAPPAKAPEAKKPQTKPVNSPAPVPKPAPKPVPKPVPKPAEAPAPKPSKKGSDVDKDYIYGLVMGKSHEPKKDDTKKK